MKESKDAGYEGKKRVLRTDGDPVKKIPYWGLAPRYIESTYTILGQGHGPTGPIGSSRLPRDRPNHMYM